MPATYNEIQKKKPEKKSQSKLKIKCGMDKQIKQILKKMLIVEFKWWTYVCYIYIVILL